MSEEQKQEFEAWWKTIIINVPTNGVQYKAMKAVAEAAWAEAFGHGYNTGYNDGSIMAVEI
jgi:hypothetical protein